MFEGAKRWAGGEKKKTVEDGKGTKDLGKELAI